MDTEREYAATLPQVGVISLRGADYPVRCDINGKFFATVEGHDLSSYSYSDLQTQAQRVPRRRVAVRFAVISPPSPGGRMNPARKGIIQHGTATGFHAVNTRSLLVDWDGSARKGAQTGERIANAVRISPDEEAEAVRLLKAAEEANQAVASFIEQHAIDPHQLVREELNAAGDDDD